MRTRRDLHTTLDAIQLRYGHGALRPIGDLPRPACLPTGIPALDAAFGGGFPRSRLTELAGALDGWGEWRALLWALRTLPASDSLALSLSGDPVDLPPLSEPKALARAAQVTGVSTGPHVLALYRADLLRRGVLGSRDVAACPHGQSVAAAGLVVMHQAPPTAKGFHFITLEDEDGMLNVIVRPDVYARYRRAIRGAALLLVTGAVQREGSVVNVLADAVAPLG